MEAAVLESRDYGADELREQLNRIISSRTFQGSNRHKRFLSYVVEKVICGEAARLKGYTLALEVFDRGDDFDPQADPVVRIEAGRLRRSLERYYLTEGKNDLILITIPKGGYVPAFSPTESTRPMTFAPAPRTQPEPIAVAVLPFRNFGEEREDRLADFLAEEISVNLACFRHLDVIPSAVSQMEPPAPGGQFSLTGSVLVLNGEVHVTTCLIENKTRISIWSKVFDFSATAKQRAAAVQEIAGAIAAEVGHPIGSLTRFVSRTKVYRNDIWVALHEAHLYTQTRDGERLPKVRALLRAAITNSPQDSEALALLSVLELDRSIGRTVIWAVDKQVVQNALDLAERAVSIEPCSATARQAILEANFRLGHVEKALEAGREAIRLNPNNSGILAVFGAQLCYMGNWEEGQRHLHKARQLVRLVPYWFRIVDVFDHYRKGEFKLALQLTKQMNSRSIVPPVLRAMLYGKLRMTQKGKQELVELSAAAPGLSVKDIKTVFSARNFDKATFCEFIEHLRSVGVNDIFPET